MEKVFIQVLRWLSPAVIDAMIVAGIAEARKNANPFDDILLAFAKFWVGKHIDID